MEDINLKPVIAIVIVSGIVFYFLNAVWAMYYTTELPLQEEFCQRWAAEQTGSSEGKMFCDQYANKFEELKHQYNLNAESLIAPRNLVLGFLGPVVGIIAFFIAARRGAERRKDEKYAKETGIMDYLPPVILGFAATALIPVFLHFVAPEPREWLPSGIINGADAKVQTMVERLRAQAGS
jgi:hypothetical protein